MRPCAPGPSASPGPARIRPHRARGGQRPTLASAVSIGLPSDGAIPPPESCAAPKGSRMVSAPQDSAFLHLAAHVLVVEHARDAILGCELHCIPEMRA